MAKMLPTLDSSGCIIIFAVIFVIVVAVVVIALGVVSIVVDVVGAKEVQRLSVR